MSITCTIVHVPSRGDNESKTNLEGVYIVFYKEESTKFTRAVVNVSGYFIGSVLHNVTL